jgi:hypothetical protein
MTMTMTNERCTVMDADGEGCVRDAGHTGRHKIRRDPDSLFGGGKEAKRKLADARKARNRRTARSADDADEAAAETVRDDKSDRIAALCEVATAMGMARVQLSNGLAWVNPQTGAAAMLIEDASGLYPASIIVPRGDAAAPVPCALMNILGVQALPLADGGVLYASGGKLIVQTPSGGLRPARLEMDPALGPAGDGEGR